MNFYLRSQMRVYDDIQGTRYGYFPMANIEITLQGVLNLLANCDSNKSPSLDKISPLSLKNTATEIAPVLF